MGATIELQDLTDSQLCQEITANIEHAFNDKTIGRRDGRLEANIRRNRGPAYDDAL
jgi:hypothetical protein